MSVDFTSGDLFDPSWGFDAMAHGVNAIGAMGKGIAVEFRRRWPRMYEDYTVQCRRGALQPGMTYSWWTGSKAPKVIYNLCTQATIGRGEEGKERAPATIEAVEESVRDMLVHAAFHRIRSIGLPRIAAGLGGLPWTKVKGLLQRVGERTQTMLVVFESFVLGGEHGASSNQET